MVRTLTIIVVVAQLLICPLRCLSCGEDASVSDVVELSADQCCRECENSSGERDTPADACSCPSCICEGATIESSWLPASEPTADFADWPLPSECDPFFVASAVATESPPTESADKVKLATHHVLQI